MNSFTTNETALIVRRTAMAMMKVIISILTGSIPLAIAVCASAGAAPIDTTANPHYAPQSLRFAVMAQASVQASPPQVKLSWELPGTAGTGYSISRRTWNSAGGFTSVASGLPATANTWTDTNVTAGIAYEYQIVLAGVDTYTKSAYGYVSAGIDLPLVDNRGTVVMLVDQTLAGSLASKLSVLQSDLISDGWKVIRHDVARSTVTLGNPDLLAPDNEVHIPFSYHISGYNTDNDGPAVRNIKQQIQNDFHADPAVNHVLIVGHVAIPYSGNTAPDGHGDHAGAQPADPYYGDMNGTWTDTKVNAPFNGTRNNANLPGDGRFDQNTIPGTGVQLAVGRIDLANMLAFAPLTETDLLRRYLAKDHAWRTGRWQVQTKCLVEDCFGDGKILVGWPQSEAPAVNCLRMAGVVGIDNIVIGGGYQPNVNDTWFNRLSLPGCLLAGGFSAGWPSGNYAVGNTMDFAKTPSYAVFTMLCGSYLGDWNYYDNVMRAVLANDGYGLTCIFAGLPNIVLHRLALGATIGDNLRLTQESTFSRYPSLAYHPHPVYQSIMGDPTLRAHPIVPPAAPSVTISGGNVTLNWTPSPTAGVVGYHVYRAASADGPFVRLSGVVPASAANPSGSPVTGATWTDRAVPSGTYTYLIKAVKQETTPGGTYYNSSLGAMVSVSITSTVLPAIATQPTSQVTK